MKTISLWAAYVVVAFFTFGHVFNANYVPHRECGERPHSVHAAEEYEGWYDCRFGASYPTHAFAVGFPAFFVGVTWPAYWAGRAAIEITKPDVTMTREETIDEIAETLSELDAIFSGQE